MNILTAKVSNIKFPLAGRQLSQSQYGAHTDVRFASSLSGEFITAIVVNPPESKLAKRTSVRCGGQLDYHAVLCLAKLRTPRILQE